MTSIEPPTDVSTPAGATAPPEKAVIASTTDLTKTYGRGETIVSALNNVSVDLYEGEFTAIMGPSGSGKSTLMHCLAGLDTPTSGQVAVAGQTLASMSSSKLTDFRRENVGFIFQAFNLIPTLTAKKNVTLPLDISGRTLDHDWFNTVIDTVNLGDRLNHRPGELSGGQQQRVACARALVARPKIIFADEPTGNLDSTSATDILTFLKKSVNDMGQTIVMVTHEPVSASYADRVLFLADGQIVDEMRDPTPDAVLSVVSRLTRRVVEQ